MMRRAILAAARSERLAGVVTRAPVSRQVVRRFVGGPDTAAGVAAARRLIDDGLTVSLDHLGEDTRDRAQADATVAAYLELLAGLDDAGLTRRVRPSAVQAEVSVKLSAIGQSLGPDGDKIALENARRIAADARRRNAAVTLDMEDHATTDSTLGVLRELRADFADAGAVLQSYLHRTEGDCRDLAHEGSRVRLCKGAYDEPPSVAFSKRVDVDGSYVRCANVLLKGAGYPMFATHDPRLIDVIGARAAAHGRGADSYEHQLLYGIRPDEQRRLAAQGSLVRVYVPYGAQWYRYLMRRLAERPANLVFFARALASRG